MAYDHQFFAAMTCPDQVTWTKDIKGLFTALDVDPMKDATKHSIKLDLSSYDSVKIHAMAVYTKVASGTMPPPGSGENPWPQEWVDKFGCWIKQGCPK